MAIVAASIGSCFRKVLISYIRSTHFRIVGAPATLRRSFATGSHVRRKKKLSARRENWGCSESSFQGRSEAVVCDTAATVLPVTSSASTSSNGYPWIFDFYLFFQLGSCFILSVICPLVTRVSAVGKFAFWVFLSCLLQCIQHVLFNVFLCWCCNYLWMLVESSGTGLYILNWSLYKAYFLIERL